MARALCAPSRLALLRWRSSLRPPRRGRHRRCVSAAIENGDDGWQLNADFDVQFSPRLEEAVTRGVPLYFVVEFELSRPRWYWFDEKPIQLSQTYKITLYAAAAPVPPVGRQRLPELHPLRRGDPRALAPARVARRRQGRVQKGRLYQANLRMRLDTGQLPKPFQLNAIASRDWTLSSDWHRWTITPCPVMKPLIFLLRGRRRRAGVPDVGGVVEHRAVRPELPAAPLPGRRPRRSA